MSKSAARYLNAVEFRLSGEKYQADLENKFWTDERVEAYHQQALPDAQKIREIAEKIMLELAETFDEWPGPSIARVAEKILSQELEVKK